MTVADRHGSLVERLFWIIKLRWIAVIGVVLTAVFVDNAVKIHVPILPLYIIAFLLASYNILFFIFLKYIIQKDKPALFVLCYGAANAQISLDLLSLAGLIHFSGGIENPFIFYFIFHMIIASILLSRRASFLQATFAACLFSFIVTSEYFGMLPHYCLKGFVAQDLHDNLIYISGISFVFISTMYIAVYMATSISVRLREREESLKKANELLREKDRTKSEYVLRVTHDIKEHLSAVQGCIEPVIEGITGLLNEKQKNLLARAYERTAKLLFFVKALLEITRIKLSKTIKMEYFSVRDMIQAALSYVEPRAREKDITLSTRIDGAVGKIKGVETYIEETVSNMLANAVKYTQRGGKIHLEVRVKSGAVLITISDTGIGIPVGELPNIFDEFYRASNARKIEKTGTGLGLSIAKQVIERHRGKIWVESKEGKGSTFFIELPAT